MADILFPPFPSNKKLPFTISPVDSDGAPVPGNYFWSVADTTIATVTVAADTLSAFLMPVKAGATTLFVTDGSITDSATGSISAVAVALNLAFGTPENQ